MTAAGNPDSAGSRGDERAARRWCTRPVGDRQHLVYGRTAQVAFVALDDDGIQPWRLRRRIVGRRDAGGVIDACVDLRRRWAWRIDGHAAAAHHGQHARRSIAPIAQAHHVADLPIAQQFVDHLPDGLVHEIAVDRIVAQLAGDLQSERRAIGQNAQQRRAPHATGVNRDASAVARNVEPKLGTGWRALAILRDGSSPRAKRHDDRQRGDDNFVSHPFPLTLAEPNRSPTNCQRAFRATILRTKQLDFILAGGSLSA